MVPEAGADDPVERYKRLMDGIPGWLDEVDVGLVACLARAQSGLGIRGDLLEIGVYHGKTAVVLGHLLGPSERLVVCDPFMSEAGLSAENALENQRYYPGFERAAFERTYLRFHSRLPVVLAVPSWHLDDGLVAAGTCRLVHVDGGHGYDVVRDDLRTARRVLSAGGIAVLDDVSKPHLPGTALAIWEAVADGDLTPFALTDAKLYATPERDRADQWRAEAERWAAHQGGIRVDDHVLRGAHVARVVPRPPPAAWASA